MIFSKRYELGKQLDEWCEDHNVCKEGMGYLSALHALGYTTDTRVSDSSQVACSATLGRITYDACATCLNHDGCMDEPDVAQSYLYADLDAHKIMCRNHKPNSGLSRKLSTYAPVWGCNNGKHQRRR